MSAYSKSVTALLGAVATVLASALTDDVVTSAEFVQMTVAGLTAFAVYLLPNAPGFGAVKTFVAAALAGLNLVAGWLANGEEITNAMWVNVVIAVAVALGVFVLPNDREPAPSA
jgi:hypothetical protein